MRPNLLFIVNTIKPAMCNHIGMLHLQISSKIDKNWEKSEEKTLFKLHSNPFSQWKFPDIRFLISLGSLQVVLKHGVKFLCFPQRLFWSDIAHSAPFIMAMPTLKWLINWYLKPAHRVLLTNCIAAKAQDVTVHDGLKKTNNLQTLLHTSSE